VLGTGSVQKFRAVFQAQFLDDQRYWLESQPKTAAKIEGLIEVILEDPFGGVGKPEPLRWGPFKRCWSRRITKEHRLVYKVQKNTITFLQCRYHY
jgi:toxin YoeB